jgi:hypothetical protein
VNCSWPRNNSRCTLFFSRPTGTKLAFNAETVPTYADAVYTITFEAKSSAQAWFKLRLSADVLGDKPMQTEKAVEITGGG